MPDTCWTVGEVAARSGVSVRTLHHYDAIGLLTPDRRSDAGYRLYSRDDVARLQQIKSMRALGFALEEIRRVLDRSQISLLGVIELHIQQLKERIDLERDLCRRLDRLAAHLSAVEDIPADECFRIMEAMSMMDRIKTYYTPEQLETLERRQKELGEDRIRNVEHEWPRLIEQMRAEMERGADPAGERVQTLALRWSELVNDFTGGDPGIARSLQTMYGSEPEVGDRFGLDSDLLAYVQRAMAAGAT